MKDEQTIVIGIPGKWENRDAIVEAITQHSGGYIFAGMMAAASALSEDIPQVEPIAPSIVSHNDKLLVLWSTGFNPTNNFSNLIVGHFKSRGHGPIHYPLF